MVENHILKSNAKYQLGSNIFHKQWLTLLLILLINSLLVSAAASVLAGVGQLLIVGILNYGIARLTVTTVRTGKEFSVNDLFCAINENWSDALVLGLLQSLFTFLWSLLFIIPGIVKSYSYALASYIQQDSENKNWEFCIQKSMRMMQGRKMQLFLLDLSFIGWYLLGLLCFGIGVLFVYPYHQMARANFYEALKASLGE